MDESSPVPKTPGMDESASSSDSEESLMDPDPEPDTDPLELAILESHKMPLLQGSKWELGNSKFCFALILSKIDERYNLSGREYNIYIVDLSDLSAVFHPLYFAPLFPTIHIVCGVDNSDVSLRDTFCVLGNTLYMFEGNFINSKLPRGKDIYAIDISSPSPQKLLKSELPKVGEMHGQKHNPAAIPTPDGQNILVFSTLREEDKDIVEKSYSVGDFELFDPKKKELERLPSIQHQLQISEWLMEAYGFINEAKLVVQFSSDEVTSMYVLDLGCLDKGWVYTAKLPLGVERLPVYPYNPSSFFKVIEDRFCFTTNFGVHDLHDFEQDDENPYNHFSDAEFTSPILSNRKTAEDYLVTLLKHNAEEFYFCESRVEKRPGHNDTQSSCRLEFEVCHVDLNKYKNHPSRLELGWKFKAECTNCIKAARFCLDLGGDFHVQALPFFFCI